MKFRTDFVTNSSDSSFLTFNIKNKRLFECLTSLGIKFEKVKKGEFSDDMRIVLPSGNSEVIDGSDNWCLPFFSDYASISAWLVATLLWEVEETSPSKEEDEYSDFSKELIQLLNDADVTHLDWNAVDSWSRMELACELEKKFGEMDEDIKDAHIEHVYGFEGEVGPAIYTEIHNGKRLFVDYSNDCRRSPTGNEQCRGLHFAIAGKPIYFKNRNDLKKLIEQMGGIVLDDLTPDADYLLCNTAKSGSAVVKKAMDLGVSILSESGFVRKYCDISSFDGIKGEDDLYEEAWDITYEGGVFEFVMQNGTQPITMEIWENGKWVKPVSESKKSIAENDTKKIMAAIFENDKGDLRKLLTIHTRDCLTTKDKKKLALANISFDELCNQGYLRFDSDSLAPENIAQDCVLLIEKGKSAVSSEDEVEFRVIYKPQLCDIDGFKSRPLEICSILNELTNGKELPGTKKLFFSMCGYRYFSESHHSRFLVCTADKNRKRKDINRIADYSKDNEAIINKLFEAPLLKEILSVKKMTPSVAYDKGFFTITEFYKNSLENKKALIEISWTFTWGNAAVRIFPNSEDKDTVDKLVPLIIKQISEIKLPVRGVIKYKADCSITDLEPEKGFYAAGLSFSK